MLKTLHGYSCSRGTREVSAEGLMQSKTHLYTTNAQYSAALVLTRQRPHSQAQWSTSTSTVQGLARGGDEHTGDRNSLQKATCYARRMGKS